MRRLALWVGCMVVSSALSGAEAIRLEITSPEAGQALFGEVTLAAAVSGNEPIQRLEFWINGQRVATRLAPPYREVVDVGEENIARTISAIAYGTSGTRVTTTLVFPKVAIDLAVELRLQQLYVTVTRDEDPVLDLERSDFTVVDNGFEQQIVTFEQGDVPMTIVVLIDASDSMTGKSFAAALAAARGFLARLGPLDEALVMVFSDRILGTTEFSSGARTLPEEFDRIRPGGGTAINGHLYAALRLLDGRQGKPVVLLLSDGSDTVSALSMEEVEWKVRRSNALIYRLQVSRGALHGAVLNTVWRTILGNRAERHGLGAAIEATGGRARTVGSVAELGPSLDAVLRELRQQYVLGYYPTGPQRPGEWHPLRIVLASPELLVRTRDGYIGR